MSSLGVHAASVAPQSDIERLKSKPGNSLEAEKDRLRKVTREFEAFFKHNMLKAMRKTVPKSVFEEDQILSGSAGKDIFTDLFDMELAREMTGGKSSIADLLFKSMEPLIDSQFEQGKPEMKLRPLLNSGTQLMPFDADMFQSMGQSDGPLPLPQGNRAGIRIQTLPKSDSTSSIVSQYGRHIRSAARDTGLDPALITAVIKAESNGDARVVSSAGAKGLMQLIDSTATELGVSDSFDPRQNIMGGARYLRKMLDRFGKTDLALAAYNAGPTAVSKHDGIPPYPETEKYVENVVAEFESIRGPGSHSKAKVR